MQEQIAGDDWLNATLSELDIVESVELVKRFSAPKAQLFLAPERIRQAVVNIVENAVQALTDMPEEKTRVLTVRTAAEGGNYVMIFDDNGPGMDPELAVESIRAIIFDQKLWVWTWPGDGEENH